MIHQNKTHLALESIFYVACYFGKGIYEERLAYQNTRLVAPVK